MKSYLSIFLIFAVLGLSACGTIGGEFCENSGYIEDTTGYKKCVSRYQASQEFYAYCEKERGLISEDPLLDQCLSQAQSTKGRWIEDTDFCHQEAGRKFAVHFAQPKQERHATLTESGDLIVSNVNINVPYSSADRDSIIAPFMKECVTAHGWYDYKAWQNGKRNVSLQSISSTLTRINTQPLQINVPEHKSLELLQAAAAGNVEYIVHLVKNGRVPVDIKNYQGYTALHVAARRGNFLGNYILN